MSSRFAQGSFQIRLAPIGDDLLCRTSLSEPSPRSFLPMLRTKTARLAGGYRLSSFALRLGGFGFRGRWRRSLPCEPFCLQTLTVVRESLLRDLVLSHCLLGIDLAKRLTRIALGFGGRLGWLKPARRLCHFFTFSRSSTNRQMASNRRPHRLEPRRGESDFRMLLLTSDLDPTMMS